MDPFSTLGLLPRFDLTSNEIVERKVELNKALHPDRYVGRPASERRAALGKSLLVNDAARTLLDPVTRAEALLQYLGDANIEANTPQPPGEFLMFVMELRQELREAGKAQNAEQVERLIQQVELKRKDTLAQLSLAFEQCLSELSDRSAMAFKLAENEASRDILVPSELKSALYGSLSELRYFRRFFDEAEAYLDEMV